MSEYARIGADSIGPAEKIVLLETRASAHSLEGKFKNHVDKTMSDDMSKQIGQLIMI